MYNIIRYKIGICMLISICIFLSLYIGSVNKELFLATQTINDLTTVCENKNQIIEKLKNQIILNQDKILELKVEKDKFKYLGVLHLTSYSKQECPNKYTSSGTLPTPNRTCAVSHDLYNSLVGKKIYIKGVGSFICEDKTASHYKGKKISKTIDLFQPSHKKAVDFGRQKKSVYMVSEKK